MRFQGLISQHPWPPSGTFPPFLLGKILGDIGGHSQAAESILRLALMNRQGILSTNAPYRVSVRACEWPPLGQVAALGVTLEKVVELAQHLFLRQAKDTTSEVVLCHKVIQALLGISMELRLTVFKAQ